MMLTPFNLEALLAGAATPITRDGRPVQIVCARHGVRGHLIGVVPAGERHSAKHRYDVTGYAHDFKHPSSDDLMLVYEEDQEENDA